MPADRREFADLLQRLAAPQWRQAWGEFLERFTPLILAICREFEHHPERVDDCFIYVCDQLFAHRCRRLRRFELDGPARFSSWLRVVVRNLCVDWRRRQLGRHRVFRSIARLSAQDQEIFRQVYEQGCSITETVHALEAIYPSIDRSQVGAALERITQQLNPRQLWLLSLRRVSFEALSDDGDPEAPPTSVRDSSPSPEALAARGEQQRRLARALAGLAPRERLLVRLRFEQGMSLDQVSRVTGLANAQQADRRLREILRRLRKQLAEDGNPSRGSV